jgi:hypothetical protein
MLLCRTFLAAGQITNRASIVKPSKCDVFDLEQPGCGRPGHFHRMLDRGGKAIALPVTNF